MDYSKEVIAYTTTIFGDVIEIVESGSSGYELHILAITMQQDKDLSDTVVYCGTDAIALNYGKDFPQMFTNYVCDSEDLTIDKTGNDEAFVSILYATSTQFDYSNPVNVTNQLNFAESLFISAIIIIFLSLISWRYIFRLTSR